MQNDTPDYVPDFSDIRLDLQGGGLRRFRWKRHHGSVLARLSDGAAVDWFTGMSGVVVGTQSYSELPASYDIVATGDGISP